MGGRRDEYVIKWCKGMEVQQGETGLWLTVAKEAPKGIVRSHIFLPLKLFKCSCTWLIINPATNIMFMCTLSPIIPL